MSFLSDYMSIGCFAKNFNVTERTVRTWISEEPVLSAGVVTRNKSVFIGTDAIGDFEDQYLFGDSLFDDDNT